MNTRLDAAQRYHTALERFLDVRTGTAEKPRLIDLAVLRGELAFEEGVYDDFVSIAVFGVPPSGAHSVLRSHAIRAAAAVPLPRMPGDWAPAILREDELLAGLRASDLVDLGRDPDQINALDERWRAFTTMASAVGSDISLIEDPGQRDTAMTTAWNLLRHRHHLTASIMGLSRWGAKTGRRSPTLIKSLVVTAQAIIGCDREWRRDIEYFVPLNPRRRVERARYDTPIDLWWWNERADCDWPAIYAAADGRAEPTAHIATCEHCRSLLDDLRGVGRALAAVRHEQARHLTAEQLVQIADGDAPDTLRREADAHLRLCTACRSDLDGLRRSGRGGEDGSH